VVTHGGPLWGCGCGMSGQLGVGDRIDRLSLVRMGSEEAFGQSGVLTDGCDIDHTMAVTEEGGLWSWGGGVVGMLGHNDEEDRVVPVRVEVGGWTGPRSCPPHADLLSRRQ
jgi:alpha-tubulin suppressor-like RCC1 family protein